MSNLILNADRAAIDPSISHLKAYLLYPGYRLMTHYRRIRALSKKKYLKLLMLWERLIYHRLCVRYGCDIPSNVKIGKGFVIKHPIGIVINSHCVIGENCSIRTGALVGGGRTGNPTIGNNVNIGGHAIVIGGIHIGDDSDIGAGAIVTHDVPPGSVVLCESARVHHTKADRMMRARQEDQ